MMQRVFQYRYMDDKAAVFYIGRAPRGSSGHIKDRCVYTVPFSSKEARETRNALLGFASKGVALERLSEMQYTPDGTPIECNNNLHVYDIPLRDFKHLSTMVMCPLVVEMDSFCDIKDYKEYVDVFYFQAREWEHPLKHLRTNNN